MSDPTSASPPTNPPGPRAAPTPASAVPPSPAGPGGLTDTEADGSGSDRDEGGAGAAARRRRRGKRGGRNRRPAGSEAGAPAGPATGAQADGQSPVAPPNGAGATLDGVKSTTGRPRTARPRAGRADSTRPVQAGDRGAAEATGAGPARDGTGDDGQARDGTGQAAPAGQGELPDLPDPPREGRPSVEAATRALVRKPKIGDTRPAPRAAEAEPAPGEDEADGVGAKRRRRRGGRGKGQPDQGDRRPGDRGGDRAGDRGVDRYVERALDDELPIVLDEETLERRRGKERKGRPVGRYLMCVHSLPQAIQIAVLEGRSLIEHYVSRPADDVTAIHGNIYLGRVQNVLPGMEAAFVDIGTPKNAVLYRGDVQYDAEDVEEKGGSRIEHLLRPGQSVLCQVTKNPIGTKGARLTQEVSMAGRFVVFIPNSPTYGISKRLADDERKRLRRILDEVRPQGHGLIVRTAAEGATAEELRRDVDRLQRQWQQLDNLAARSRAPALLYREPPLAVRVIREEFNRDYRGVIIDDPALYQEVRDYVEALIPELADRVELYDDPELPIFERMHIHEQLHKALDRKVWLPSGGSLIIERTEALTVIDVNTGKNVGSSNLEDTVFVNNLEAAEEIARQLRLRDIGGIIVIDFIDMEIKKNREEVLRCFKDALARDKTRTQVFDMSELGLVEMTRKRVSEGLVESFSTTCPNCNGRGFVLDESLL